MVFLVDPFSSSLKNSKISYGVPSNLSFTRKVSTDTHHFQAFNLPLAWSKKNCSCLVLFNIEIQKMYICSICCDKKPFAGRHLKPWTLGMKEKFQRVYSDPRVDEILMSLYQGLKSLTPFLTLRSKSPISQLKSLLRPLSHKFNYPLSCAVAFNYP